VQVVKVDTVFSWISHPMDGLSGSGGVGEIPS
jgi:hypothetical protein